jgi:oligoendopeptidase F
MMVSQNNDKAKAPRWEIDSIFPGGSKSIEFAEFRKVIARDLVKLGKTLDKLPRKLDDNSRAKWAKWILDLQELYERLHLASAYCSCLVSQDVNDQEAMRIDAEIDEYYSRWGIMKATLESFSTKQSGKEWQKLVAKKGVADISFYLDEMREKARMKMPEPLEKLVLELSVNGYHAWNRIYDKMAGDLRVALQDDGEKKEISLGQNAPRMSDPDRAVRRDAFQKMQNAWETRANLAAIALNSQAGFRLSIYKNRNWDSPLFEPLQNARMKNETIDAMWNAVIAGRPKLRGYIEAKKKLMGTDKFCWYDQEAPLGKSTKTFTFNEAGDFIVEHIGSFSDEMGKFTREALDKRWVEAENRPGKGAGGWCSRIPIRKESRIFMTFTGNFNGLGTLAHELGHAYHGFVLKDVPPFASIYPMNIAETASIFNELRVTDAAFEAARDYDEKLMLSDQKLAGALSFMSNIHARFIFDSRFYEERKAGMVSRDRLSEIMKEAQKEAFFGILDEQEGLHPLFWASKLHFYITGAPFYNFPYTFGFLFANGVYDRAIKEGKAFAKDYRALLADTGRMTTEEVAKKHLGVDLTKEDFWKDAVARVLSNVEPFLKMVKND